MKRSRLAALFLALAMLLCSLPVSAAESNWLVPKVKNYAGFADVKGTWCESYVETVYEAGLMTGRSASAFDISSNLTIAQITVITARLHSLLNGGDGILPAPGEGEEWYQPAIDYLKAHVEDANGVGPILGTRIVQMETVPLYAVQNAPRWDLVSFLTSVLPKDALAPINSVTVLPDSADENELRFYNAGILNGVDEYGTFLGSKPLTRGAAAAILARVIDPGLRLTFTLKSFDLCRDVLGVEPDAVLLTVDGQDVTAELFAYQLCTSLLQWEGTADEALDDAIRSWCEYYAPFQVLAKEKGVTLSAETLAKITAEAQASAGLYGTTAAYQQFQKEGIALSSALCDLYIEADWKWGESDYHSDLEKVSKALLEKSSAADALRSMDFKAVYGRLKSSPFAAWKFY